MNLNGVRGKMHDFLSTRKKRPGQGTSDRRPHVAFGAVYRHIKGLAEDKARASWQKTRYERNDHSGREAGRPFSAGSGLSHRDRRSSRKAAGGLFGRSLALDE